MPAVATLAQAMLRLWARITPSERGSFRMVRAARRVIPRDQWNSEFQLPSGLKMQLDLSIYPDCCMAFGLYEISIVRQIHKHLKPGDHFVDGGANIGYISMIAALRVGPTGRVDAFEPEPTNRARLIEHLKRNGLESRVTVHPVALTDQRGQVTIHRPDTTAGGLNHGASSLFAAKGVKTIDTQVDSVRLDEHLAGTRPKLIKLDLEGAEPLAIRGAEGLLTSDSPPALICEYNPSQAAAAESDPDDLLHQVWAIQPGYTAYRIGAGLTRVDPERIDATLSKQTNLLLRVE